MKKFTITTDNSHWMSGLERAYLGIKSQKGGSISIRKLHMSKFTKVERELVWRCVGDGMIRNYTYEVQVTKEEMYKLLRLSKY